MHSDKSSANRKSYSKEFKEAAIKMVIESNETAADVARKLGINSGTLRHWISRWRRSEKLEKGPLTQKELAQWKADLKEIDKLKKENDLFRKELLTLHKQQYRNIGS